MSEPKKRWVGWATEESRAAGQVSAQAVVETVLAVGLYWWLAGVWDSYVMLIVSPCMAFLVLLRSPESVAEGVLLFDQWLFALKSGRGPASSLDKFLLSIVLLGNLFAVLLAMLKALSLGHAIPLEFIPACCTIAVSTLCIQPRIIGRLMHFCASAKLPGGSNYVVIVYLLLIVVFYSFLVRAYATSKFLFRGLQRLKVNWVVLSVATSIVDHPEFIPGLPKDHDLSVETFWRKLPRKSRSISIAAFMGVFPILYLPSILFRVTLKSTAWLYCPLIWVIHTPRKLRTENGRKVWVGYAARSKLDYALVLVAIGSAAYLTWQGINTQNLDALIAANAGQPFTPWHLLLAIDPSQYKLWYWITFPATLLTVILFFWFDKIRIRLTAGEQITENNTQIRILIALSQVQAALWYIWIVITLLSVALAAWTLGKLPAEMSPVFDWFVIPITNLWLS